MNTKAANKATHVQSDSPDVRALKARHADFSAQMAAQQRTLPETGYVRWSRLRHFIPVARETVRKLELAGRFPRRVELSPNVKAWPCAELHVWFSDPKGYRACSAETATNESTLVTEDAA